MNYYNDNDRQCAAWLRELTKAGLIPPGDVDERSIADVTKEDIQGYTQCHFFAGIGGWPEALRLAGWPTDRHVWTGSCPCPPFSTAGKKFTCPQCSLRNLVPHPFRTGYFVCAECGHEWLADGRHLWPEFRRLIEACQPDIVMGEQVAGADGLTWLAGVQASMEALSYGFRRTDLPAAGISAPHIRQRLFWVGRLVESKSIRANRVARTIQQADGRQESRQVRESSEPSEISGRVGESEGIRFQKSRQEQGCSLESSGTDGRVAQPSGSGIGDYNRQAGRQGREPMDSGAESVRQGNGETGSSGVVSGSTDGRLADTERLRSQGRELEQGEIQSGGSGSGFWDNSILIPCADGKQRRIEPSIFPLAHGLPGRVGLLRGAGNSIVPQVAAEFVRAFMEKD